MNDVKTIRAKHLHARFKELAAEFKERGIPYTSIQICEIISREPAPRFYLTEEYAMNRIYSIRNGCTQTTRQLKDLYRIFRRTGDIHAAINTQAPSFYLSAARIYRLLIDTVRL